MKKDKIGISLIGFTAQIVFLFFITLKPNIWERIYLYYVPIVVLIFLYNLIVGQKDSLRKSSVILFSSTLLASILSGLAVRSPLLLTPLLTIYGAVTGVLVMMLVYHLRRLFFGGMAEPGFDYSIEICLTFFGFAAYPVVTYFNPAIIDAVFSLLILLALSLLAGLLISAIQRRAAQLLTDAIKQGTDLENYSPVQISIIAELFEELKKIFIQVNRSIDEIVSIRYDIKVSGEALSAASEQMNASLQEVSSTIQHIAQGAQEQSETITRIARSLEELNNLTTSISSQVKMAAVSSRRTTDSARKGLEFTATLAKVLKEILEQTRFIEEKMAELRDQATEIKKILDIINGITEQTDLLALNAAIEAARVGEQGKGFAVVAEEIRNLATEAQRSSSTVENLILEINRTTQELNKLLNIERERIDEANVSAAQSEEEFTGITKAVDLVTEMIARINEAAANQAENTKELVKRVEQVAQVAADTAASTQEVSAAVEEQTASMQEFTSTTQTLSSIVTKLEEAVRPFIKK